MPSSTSGRQKKLLGLLGAVVLFAGALEAGLAWRARQYTVTIERVRGNLYLLVGRGLNAAALVTDEGIVLVDVMQSGWWGPAAYEKLRTVSDKPIITIINTNSHPAHSANNGFFSNPKTEIIAHENTRSRLVNSERFQGDAARYLPQTTFRERLSLTRGKDRIDLYYFGAANTDGDAWVVFPGLGVMHAGDVITKDDLPEISRTSGGSGVAHPATLAKAMSSIKGVDLVITGHGINDAPRPIVTWRELGEHQRLTHDLVLSVRDVLAKQMNAEQALTWVRSQDRFKTYERRRLDAAAGAIYDELKDELIARGPRFLSGPAVGPHATSLRTSGSAPHTFLVK